MPTTFLHLPGELRNIIYEDVLVKNDGQAVQCTSRSPKNGLTPGLLTVNRKIHDEAITMLYSRNRFQFPAGYTLDIFWEIYWFFVQIGCKNASYIRHVVCPFPMFELQIVSGIHCTDVGRFDPVGKWCADLEALGKYCGRLDTFTMIRLPHQADGVWTELAVPRLIGRINDSCKAVSSQLEVIVEISGKNPGVLGRVLVRHMKQIGWKIRVTQ